MKLLAVFVLVFSFSANAAMTCEEARDFAKDFKEIKRPKQEDFMKMNEAVNKLASCALSVTPR